MRDTGAARGFALRRREPVDIRIAEGRLRAAFFVRDHEWIFAKPFLYEKQDLCYTFVHSPIGPRALPATGGHVWIALQSIPREPPPSPRPAVDSCLPRGKMAAEIGWAVNKDPAGGDVQMVHRSFSRAAFALSAFCSTALIALSAAQAAGFSAEYVFGDSLSDNGNLAELLRIGNFPNPPSFHDSFTNGPVAVARLAQHLGLSLNALPLGDRLSGSPQPVRRRFLRARHELRRRRGSVGQPVAGRHQPCQPDRRL